MRAVKIDPVSRTITEINLKKNPNNTLQELYEIIECDLSSTSKFAGQQLKDIANPGQYLVLLIKKPGSKNYELPQGNTVLASGDHLVIIQKTGDKKVLEKFSK